MKKFIKEIILTIIQLCIFFILPAVSGPADIMGAIVLLYCTIFLTSLILGIISNNNIKFIYPIVISLLFAITIPVYYNSSAYIYLLYIFITSMIFVLIGHGIKTLFCCSKFFKNHRK